MRRGTAGHRSAANGASHPSRGCRRCPSVRRAGCRRSSRGRRWPTHGGRAGRAPRVTAWPTGWPWRWAAR
ncbi:hypothetical protein ACFPRL_19655 [Pseudoclavibacter helvolus]